MVDEVCFCFHILKATLCCCCTVLVNFLFFFYVVLLQPFGCISKAPFCWCCLSVGATLSLPTKEPRKFFWTGAQKTKSEEPNEHKRKGQEYRKTKKQQRNQGCLSKNDEITNKQKTPKATRKVKFKCQFCLSWLSCLSCPWPPWPSWPP